MTDTTITDQGGLTLPMGPNWFDLSIGAQPDLGYLETQVDARIGREPELLDSRQKLVDMLVYFARDASSREGVARAAIWWALDDLDGVSVATLYTSVYEDNMVGNIDELITFLQARLTPRHANDRTDPIVDVRELLVGKAVRVEVITENPARKGVLAEETDGQDEATGDGVGGFQRSVLLQTAQYWCPIPGQNLVVVFTFTTPNLAGAEALVTEFDRLIEQLRVTP